MTHSLIIGVTMCIDIDDRITKDVAYNYVRREYGEVLQRMGAQPIFIDASIDLMVAAQLCDGVVISGGEDMDPTLYGQEKRDTLAEEPRTRTDWERRLIAACDEWGKPILGVCYGMQLLNVHYGGTLYQDIERDHGSHQSHGSRAAPVRHAISFERSLFGVPVGEAVSVTARHHQAVDRLGEGMLVAARAEDGVIEAIIGNGHVGVQWHPESDESAEWIYKGFITQCVRRKRSAMVLRRSLRPRVLTDFFSLISRR